jgi:hypothetical protein
MSVAIEQHHFPAAGEYEEVPAPVDPGRGHEARGFPAATKLVLSCTAAAVLCCVAAAAALMRTHVVHAVPAGACRTYSEEKVANRDIRFGTAR